ncbi:chalcone isomerase family protein [Aliidiomarina haloalkalitolerans]|uniref:Chalcone isomerase domain-containing protein n=1 Tax=Aliidiomarina haloalkalitolerans TaxID=859059 RepID=A0A432VYK7_9GAMM|nr:chalcone isomerase family protein [Aliidiomarina haloalkalitolerans]RUO21749.1 hypothetical protein CWE06_02555 [Aliidiomarina haloalkalitolerans]
MVQLSKALVSFAFCAACVALPVQASQQCLNAAKSQNEAQIAEALKPVGETRLRVLFMRIYDAALFTDSGDLDNAEQVALAIEYARNFSAQQLVNQTRDEWERMDLVTSDSETWLAELNAMWPDVNSGDCIVAVRNEEGGTRFFSRERELGVIEAPGFAERFFAIWLSEQARFRRSRDELVGERG